MGKPLGGSIAAHSTTLPLRMLHYAIVDILPEKITNLMADWFEDREHALRSLPVVEVLVACCSDMITRWSTLQSQAVLIRFLSTNPALISAAAAFQVIAAEYIVTWINGSYRYYVEEAIARVVSFQLADEELAHKQLFERTQVDRLQELIFEIQRNMPDLEQLLDVSLTNPGDHQTSDDCEMLTGMQQVLTTFAAELEQMTRILIPRLQKIVG